MISGVVGLWKLFQDQAERGSEISLKLFGITPESRSPWIGFLTGPEETVYLDRARSSMTHNSLRSAFCGGFDDLLMKLSPSIRLAECTLLTCCFYATFLLPAAITAQAQDTPAANPRLPFKAVLVLSPQFCATRQPYRPRDVGKLLCKELEPALSSVFSSLTNASEIPTTGDRAELVLLPRVISASSAGMSEPSTVELEWTVKDKSGRIVLIQTVTGDSERRRMGFDKKMEEAVKDVANKTASNMAAAPELARLSQGRGVVSETSPLRVGQAAPDRATSHPNSYTLEYLHSEKKWDHAFRKTNYDEISKFFQDRMAIEMKLKGFESETPSDRACCKLTVDIFQVKTVNNGVAHVFVPYHDSFKPPGVVVTASMKIEDGNTGSLVYTKEFQGAAYLDFPGNIERYTTVLHKAIGVLVQEISHDDSFNKALTSALSGSLQ